MANSETQMSQQMSGAARSKRQPLEVRAVVAPGDVFRLTRDELRFYSRLFSLPFNVGALRSTRLALVRHLFPGAAPLLRPRRRLA